jgi:hypothetical protein
VIRGSVLLGRRLALSFAWRVGEGSGRRLAELVVHVSPLRRAAKCWAKSWRSCSGKQEKKDDDGKDDDGKDDDGKDEEEEEEEEEEERLALMMLASWCCVEEQALHLSLGDVCAEPAFAALFARRRRESRLLYKTRQRGQLSAAPNENRR